MKDATTCAVLANATQIATEITNEMVGHEISRAAIDEESFFLKAFERAIATNEERKNVKG